MMSGVYSTLLFLHIVAALGLFVVEGVAFLTLRELRTAQHAEAAQRALARQQVVERAGHVLPVVLLLSALALCALRWGFTTPWVLLSLGGFVALAVLIRTVDAPRLQGVKRLMSQEAPFTAEVRPALHDPVLRRASRVRLGVLLWLVFLMTVKPALLLGVGSALLLACALLPVRPERLNAASA